MKIDTQHETFLLFKVKSMLAAIAVKELSASAHSCPNIVYDGLPFGIKGVTQWAGQTYPILDLEAICFGDQKSYKYKNDHSAMVFSTEFSNIEMGAYNFKSYAIQLPEEVNIVKAKKSDIKKQNSRMTIQTDEGLVAEILTFEDLIIQLNQDSSKLIPTAANF